MMPTEPPTIPRTTSPPPGPIAGTPLAPLASLAEKLYLRELNRRNTRFDQGVGVVTLDRPVISVGNISTGGTGKTPMVKWVVEQLLEAGHRPAIAMRGYGSKPGTPSDEQDEYRRAFKDVPVVAQPNRTEGLLTLFHTDQGEQVDCVVLDDGFQHRKLSRKLDIVLIDLSAGSLTDRCLPAGHLREPVENLARADAVVLTHAERVTPADIDAQARAVRELTSRPPVAVARHAWHGFDSTDDAPTPKRVHIACAIGNPKPFLAQAREHFDIANATILPDHNPFKPATVRKIRAAAEQAGALLCTNKDWSKLRHHDWTVPVLRPRLAHAFDSGEHELRELILSAAKPLQSPHE